MLWTCVFGIWIVLLAGFRSSTNTCRHWADITWMRKNTDDNYKTHTHLWSEMRRSINRAEIWLISIYLLFIHSIDLSFVLSIICSIYRLFNRSIYRSFYRSIVVSFYLLIYLSFCRSICLIQFLFSSFISSVLARCCCFGFNLGWFQVDHTFSHPLWSLRAVTWADGHLDLSLTSTPVASPHLCNLLWELFSFLELQRARFDILHSSDTWFILWWKFDFLLLLYFYIC